MRFAPMTPESQSKTMAMTPTDIVQCQLDAYNAHDLDRFADCFSENVRIFRMPAEAPGTVGKAALRAFYAGHRFSIPGLRAPFIAGPRVGPAQETRLKRARPELDRTRLRAESARWPVLARR